MMHWIVALLVASLALSTAVYPQNAEALASDFAANPIDAVSIDAFNAARLSDLQITASDGEELGYSSTVLFYYVGGLEQASGSIIAVDRICDLQPATPGRGVCDWQYRYTALQAPLTDPAMSHPPDQLDIFTVEGRHCSAISAMLTELRLGPDPTPGDVWMGSPPQPDLYDRQYRRLEIELGPVYAPTTEILVEGSHNPWLRDLAVRLQSPYRECGGHEE